MRQLLILLLLSSIACSPTTPAPNEAEPSPDARPAQVAPQEPAPVVERAVDLVEAPDQASDLTSDADGLTDEDRAILAEIDALIAQDAEEPSGESSDAQREVSALIGELEDGATSDLSSGGLGLKRASSGELGLGLGRGPGVRPSPHKPEPQPLYQHTGPRRVSQVAISLEGATSGACEQRDVMSEFFKRRARTFSACHERELKSDATLRDVTVKLRV